MVVDEINNPILEEYLECNKKFDCLMKTWKSEKDEIVSRLKITTLKDIKETLNIK